MVIIGISGTLGAGKGTVVDYLVKNRNFKHFSARGFLIEEIEKRELDVNRDNMVMVANELRTKNGPSYVADKLFEKAVGSGNNCVIESLRTVGEIESLRKKGNFILLAVDADPKLRYKRVCERKSSTDDVSFEEFLNNEKREMENVDPNKQNLGECIGMADFLIENNGSLDDLNKKIEEILKVVKI